MIDERSQMTIVSNILKKKCKDKLISQKQVCEITGKSKQHVSAFFAGERLLGAGDVSKIVSIIDKNQKFNFNLDNLKNIRIFLEEYLNEYYFGSDDFYLNKMAEVLTGDIYYSLAFPEYIGLMCAYKYNKEGLNSTLAWIEEVEENYTESLKLSKSSYWLFLLIKAEVFMDKENWRDALLTLEEAKEQMSSSSSCLVGVIYLYEGICYNELNEGLKALFCFQNAEKIMLETRNYNRTLAASKNIGTCFIRLNYFDLAEKQFKKTLSEAKQLKRADIIDICYVSLTNAYFQQGKFLDSIEAGSKVSSNYKRKLHYIHMGWSYFFIGENKKSRDVLRLMEYVRGDAYYQMMGALLLSYLNDKDSEIKVKQLKEMIKLNEDNNTDKLWCYKLLVSEYEKNNDFKNLAICQKQILNLLGYVSFVDK